MVAQTPVKTPSSKVPTAPSVTATPTCARVTANPKAREERILVTVRVRPLTRREQALYDLIAWDFPDDNTIVLKNPNHERQAAPYSFDKVFGPDSLSQKVYEEGAKDVALSVLSGINATIFAYGQTSSGKTFTMRGITENAVSDIYQHIMRSPERDYILKFSALEIYNETVVDLLNRESGFLRLLDDPEKGTLVEKLVEEVVKDSQHLRNLINTCEAQRQVGETALNDKSSRSHQIIRLTTESTVRENTGHVKSFIANLNLVDLAGSERTTQTIAGGTRLKEGSHINRSLLTLTTVIRKLSAGRQNCHIPYRNSKLTRILQPSLGGNARTAIVCTMSPALSHVEQSRNTLSFATSAKRVMNTAQVNMVVSDKRLVKHLQKEVARLEAELQSPGLSSSSSSSSSSCLRLLLLEKDLRIQQMEREMKELKRQRDFVLCQLELERKAQEPKGLNECEPSRQTARCLSFDGELEPVISERTLEDCMKKRVQRQVRVRQSTTFTDPSLLVQEIQKLELQQRQLGAEANRALEVLHKEVVSNNLGNQDAAKNIAKLLLETKDMQTANSLPVEFAAGEETNLKEEISRLDSHGSTIASLEDKLENVQKSIDKYVSTLPGFEGTSEVRTQSKKKKVIPFTLSNSANMPNLLWSPCSPLYSTQNAVDLDVENEDPGKKDVAPFRKNWSTSEKVVSLKVDDSMNAVSSRVSTPSRQQANSINMKKMQKMFKNAADENIKSIRAYVNELKERVAKLQYQKQLLFCQVLELEANEVGAEGTDSFERSPVPWQSMFEDQRKQIIMLWHLCHVSITRRTQFFLLFKGEPADQIYMEVELRRLTWLEQHLAELGNASPALLGDEPASSVLSSIKALKQEREYLAKRVSWRLRTDERESLYLKWEIPPVGKQRRLQLVNKLWTDPHNMEHVKESAEIVAKLVGFCESGEHVSKEMFELNFVTPSDKKRWMGWNLISNLLHL